MKPIIVVQVWQSALLLISTKAMSEDSNQIYGFAIRTLLVVVPVVVILIFLVVRARRRPNH